MIVESNVVLSPSGEVSVCPGNQLSFSCSTNLGYLEWNVIMYQSGAPYSRKQRVYPTSSFAHSLMVNGYSFRVTRDSVDGSRRINSTLTVNATTDLNGTDIYCYSSSEQGSSLAAVTIHLITPDLSMIMSSIICYIILCTDTNVLWSWHLCIMSLVIHKHNIIMIYPYHSLSRYSSSRWPRSIGIQERQHPNSLSVDSSLQERNFIHHWHYSVGR